MSWSFLIMSVVSLLALAYRRRDSEQFMMIIAAFLALFTMILLPFMGYNYFDKLEITKLYLKQMRVPMAVYFNECQPIIYAFVLGVLVFQIFDKGSNRMDSLRSLIDRFTALSWRELIFFFLCFQFLSMLETNMVTSLQFFFFGLGSSKYGVLLVMFRKSQIFLHRILILVFPLLESLQGGMFQGYLAMIFVILLLAGWLKNGKRLFMLTAVAGMLVPLLLIAKNELRSSAVSDELTLKRLGEVLYETQLKEGQGSELFGFSTVGSFELYRRLNQGWLFSAVLEKNGQSEEREHGVLIKSIVASVVPRVLWPDKPKAGGRDKIDKYTNLTRQGATSMNISPFGDIVVEFRGFGAFVVSLVYAIMLCKLSMLLIELAGTGRISFLILPLIFSQIYKVETDIVTVLNFLIKGLIIGKILLYAQNWMRHRIPE